MPRFSSQTWFTLFVTTALLFVAVNIQAGWLFILVFAVAAILICSWILGRLWIGGRLQVERFASPVFEGETLDVLVRITNLSSAGKYLLLLEDRIPGKKIPNPVFLFFPWIEKGRTVERRYRKTAERRGLYRSNTLNLFSSGPSGFFQCKRVIDCKTTTSVYPIARPFPFHPEGGFGFPAPGEKGVTLGKGGDDEFFGIREYEPGGSLKAIHWSSSAKAGKLMVRETSRTYPAMVSFYLDCDQAWLGDTFEEMLRLAAYAIEKSLEEGERVRLFRNGEMIQRDWWGNLEALASMEAEEPKRLPQQIKSHMPVLLGEKRVFFFTSIPESFVPAEWDSLKGFSRSLVRAHFIILDLKQGARVKEEMFRSLRAQGVSLTAVGGRQRNG